MKTQITFFILLFTTLFAFSQEGTYHILHTSNDRNTGKLVETMYLQVKQHPQLGEVALLSLQKGVIGIPFRLDKASTKKANKKMYSYLQSFIVEYDENSYVSFDVAGLSSEGKLLIKKPNYFSKIKSNLEKMNNETIEKYAQEIYQLTK